VAGPARVLILGGGFGGVYAALRLERAVRRGAAVEVTLVNRENYLLFTPMLHEVAAGDLDVAHIVNPIRKLLRGTRFVQGEVRGIDLARRQVTVVHGGDHPHVLDYDHLVLALGATTNFHGLPGVAERALTMKGLGDAVELRNRLVAVLEQADVEGCGADRAPLLGLVVAGGGFAGVETVAAVHDFLEEALPFYPNVRAAGLRVVLVHEGRELLPELGPALGGYARRKLVARGVEVRLETRIAGVTDAGVLLGDGTTLPAGTLVWTAGTAAHPLLAALPCAGARGRVATTACLDVPGWPGLWALGDCALVPDPATGAPYPPTAQHALRQGRAVADNIVAAVAGRPPRPFRFTTLGLLASLGRRSGVARVLGVNFAGFPAWWLWRTIYLAKLPRVEKKVRVALDWLLDLLFTKDLVEFRTGRAAAVPGAGSDAGGAPAGAEPAPAAGPACAAGPPAGVPAATPPGAVASGVAR
jgi:NADH dehydrogenase